MEPGGRQTGRPRWLGRRASGVWAGGRGTAGWAGSGWTRERLGRYRERERGKGAGLDWAAGKDGLG